LGFYTIPDITDCCLLSADNFKPCSKTHGYENLKHNSQKNHAAKNLEKEIYGIGLIAPVTLLKTCVYHIK
jgi:hypothetical protein